MLARRCLRVLPAAARPTCCSSARWAVAAVPAAAAVAAVAVTTPALADGGPDPSDAAEAQRVLEEYFAATDPVPGGSGAVRLKKPLVDGSRGVDGYHASVAAAVREGGEPAQDGAEGEGRAAWAPTTLQMLREMQASFAAARDWDQFHTPRNLLIALVGEVGEVGEIFQWKGEVERGLPQFSAEEKAHVAEELSDVRPTDLHQHPALPYIPSSGASGLLSAEAFGRTGVAVPRAAGGRVRRRPRRGGARQAGEERREVPC